MHPALSIIAFTTSSGLGYGLAVVLGLGLLDPATLAAKVAHVIAGLLIVGGLMSSTLHLGNPQRAWRALSQWRTSWLSREGVLAIVTFVPFGLLTIATLFFDRWWMVAGIATALLSLVTVYCTAMIYASLKAIDAWHTPLTPASYLSFALAGGFTTGAAFAAMGGGWFEPLAIVAAVALVVAWATKLMWRNRMMTVRPTSTPESATQLGAIGRVRLFEPPHMNGNYLTREMGYRVARKHARKLAIIAVVAGGVLPILLLVVAIAAGTGPAQVVLAVIVVLFHAIGVVVERWLFFAEARHAVSNYYGQ
ncbi:MAG: dimethyl sulfoxide reductase anchor subunit [Rhizobiaceae bacterium]|nr:dimethyl sulfoxide reductase anchor subunit [Rhizobiaceae bacterium]MCV0408800.1 dimethyl sulfoxide reductase anchor subunit [Rhizobiaceae bacterium]